MLGVVVLLTLTEYPVDQLQTTLLTEWLQRITLLKSARDGWNSPTRSTWLYETLCTGLKYELRVYSDLLILAYFRLQYWYIFPVVITHCAINKPRGGL